MSVSKAPKCPFCRFPDVPGHALPAGDMYRFRCPNCGEFLLEGRFKDLTMEKLTDVDRGKLSCHVFQNKNPSAPATIAHDNYEKILKDFRFPSIDVQLDILVLWIGTESKAIGKSLQGFDLRKQIARIGSVDLAGSLQLLDYLKDTKLLTYGQASGGEIGEMSSVALTVDGWRRFIELNRKRVVSNRAVMVMDFHDPNVKTAYETCFKKACSRAGFELNIIPEISDTGSITHHIAVAILNCKFVVADLTQNNNGAYWESGFAEGLEKPVFYTCEKGFFDKPRTHFDVNHHATTLWEISKLHEAEKDLVARIRRRFQDEAQMEG